MANLILLDSLESPAKPPETLPLTIRWGSFKSTLDPEIQPSSTRILKSTISAYPRPNRQNQSPHTLRLYSHERTKCCDSLLQKHALFLFSGRMVLKPEFPNSTLLSTRDEPTRAMFKS